MNVGSSLIANLLLTKKERCNKNALPISEFKEI
jgi:hypothetical protein